MCFGWRNTEKIILRKYTRYSRREKSSEQTLTATRVWDRGPHHRSACWSRTLAPYPHHALTPKHIHPLCRGKRTRPRGKSGGVRPSCLEDLCLSTRAERHGCVFLGSSNQFDPRSLTTRLWGSSCWSQLSKISESALLGPLRCSAHCASWLEV